MHLGHLHVAMVHLPIGLALAAGAADLLWLITKRTFFKNAGAYCLAAAILITPLVLWTGDMLSDEVVQPGNPAFADRVDDHETAAYVSFGLMVAAGAVRWTWARWPAKWQPIVYALLIQALVVAIVVTGDLGGKLVYGPDWFANLFTP